MIEKREKKQKKQQQHQKNDERKAIIHERNHNPSTENDFYYNYP